MSADHGSSHDAPPPPPEPRTPMWLPALGAALFLLAGLWLATRPADPTAQPANAAPSARPLAGNTPDASAPLNADQAAQIQKILHGLPSH